VQLQVHTCFNDSLLLVPVMKCLLNTDLQLCPTCVLCKVLESIIRDGLVDYLESAGLIRDTQHGFRKGRSCLSNLLCFLDQVTGLVDNGFSLDIVYLDLAKAFDKVPHQRLLNKLKAYGIHGKLHAWLADWLVGRRQ